MTLKTQVLKDEFLQVYLTTVKPRNLLPQTGPKEIGSNSEEF